MFKKLFYIKEERNHKIYNICGIKVKMKIINSNNNKIKKDIEDLKTLTNSLTRGRYFFYTNESKLSYNEKKRFLAGEFYRRVGYYPNLTNPKSFCEKLNWMKLNFINPLESIVIDKYEFKNYIKEKLGEGYTIPLIGVYNDMDEVDFDTLPNEFVIKTTNGYGGRNIKIVKNKKLLNIDLVKYEFNEMINNWNNLYYYSLSNGYKNIKPRIIIEKYMPIRENDAIEYKMFCFHGEVKYCLIEIDYFGKNPKRAFYSKDFKEMPFSIGNFKKQSISQKPDKYDEMVNISEKLAKEFPFVRVDFYVIENKIYIGELTFISGGGFSTIRPVEWDFKMGEWLDLTKLNKNYVNIVKE